MIYCGVPANQWTSYGVAIAVKISERIIETRIKVLNRNFTIVGVYAPVEGNEQDTGEFYRELQQSMDKIPKN